MHGGGGEEEGEWEVEKKRKIDDGDEDEDEKLAERFEGVTDRELEETIQRLNKTLSKVELTDGGKKLRINIARHQDELERRRRRRRIFNAQKDDEKCKKPGQLQGCPGNFDGTQKEVPVQEKNESIFARCFLSKMEAHNPSKTTMNNCDNHKMKANGHRSSAGRHKLDSASRQTPFRCPTTLSTDSDDGIVDKDDKAAGSAAVTQSKEELAGESSKMRNSSQVQPSRARRKHNTVVLVVEDESEVSETDQQIEGVDNCKKDARIDYPSRDAAGSVEIRYSDLDCLAAEAYLTSTIINFYIRYLHQHICPISKEGEDYHFFNTYFYERLRKFSLKNDMKASFTKIRRWWKGVNLFEKAYIFLPIHDKYHWSLVVICIPDKEDGNGPSVLHLDSLGLHSSQLIFDNMKRFLVGEWQFLKDEALSDPPFTDNIWRHFPRRINVKAIEVPQQGNEYDCGLFVLSFIEQFILKAPRRMKKEELAMLGKKWFRPVKASLLRGKIHRLLEEEFNKEKEETGLPGA